MVITHFCFEIHFTKRESCWKLRYAKSASVVVFTLFNKITCNIFFAIAHCENCKTLRRKKPIIPALKIAIEPKNEDLEDDVQGFVNLECVPTPGLQ